MNLNVPASVVLMIDDNPSDVFFMRHAFEQTAQPVEFVSTSDGAAALEHLHGKLSPDLVLLDFFLNGETGRELLKDIQENSALATRTVLLSGLDPSAVKEACGTHVEVHEKPGTLDGWLNLATRILFPAAEAQPTPVAA